MVTHLSPKTQKILQSLAECFEEIGVDYIGHLVRSGSKETAFFSHTEWYEYYVNKNFKATDPYTNFALASKSPFFMWNHVPLNNKESQDVVKARSDLCHIGAGMTFYSKLDDIEHIFALASSSNNDMSGFIENEKVFKEILGLKAKMIEEHGKDHKTS